MDQHVWLPWLLFSFPRRPRVTTWLTLDGGLNRRARTGGHGPCWQFPWHPGPVWAALTGSDSSQRFLHSEGGTEREGGSHTNTHWTETLLIGESGKKKKKAQMQRPLCHLFESASCDQNAWWPFLQNTNQKNHITEPTARHVCNCDEVQCHSKQNTIVLPISLTNNKLHVWSVLWSSSSTENYSPGLYSTRAKWCSHLVGSGFYSRYKRTAMEKTTRLG